MTRNLADKCCEDGGSMGPLNNSDMVHLHQTKLNIFTFTTVRTQIANRYTVCPLSLSYLTAGCIRWKQMIAPVTSVLLENVIRRHLAGGNRLNPIYSWLNTANYHSHTHKWIICYTITLLLGKVVWIPISCSQITFEFKSGTGKIPSEWWNNLSKIQS
jgi:hypothetical protein